MRKNWIIQFKEYHNVKRIKLLNLFEMRAEFESVGSSGLASPGDPALGGRSVVFVS